MKININILNSISHPGEAEREDGEGRIDISNYFVYNPSRLLCILFRLKLDRNLRFAQIINHELYHLAYTGRLMFAVYWIHDILLKLIMICSTMMLACILFAIICPTSLAWPAFNETTWQILGDAALIIGSAYCMVYVPVTIEETRANRYSRKISINNGFSGINKVLYNKVLAMPARMTPKSEED